MFLSLKRICVPFAVLGVAALFAANALAADFRSVEKAPAVLYDAPSQKSRGLYLYGEGTPLEILSSIEGMDKVRDWQGTIGWVDRAFLSDKRTLQVRVSRADVHEQPQDTSPVIFEAEQDVVLLMDENAPSAAETEFPGWVRVLYTADNQVGYIRIDRVFGL